MKLDINILTYTKCRCARHFDDFIIMSDLCITYLFYIVNNILSSNISSIYIRLPSAYTVQCTYRHELKSFSSDSSYGVHLFPKVSSWLLFLWQSRVGVLVTVSEKVLFNMILNFIILFDSVLKCFKILWVQQRPTTTYRIAAMRAPRDPLRPQYHHHIPLVGVNSDMLMM